MITLEQLEGAFEKIKETGGRFEPRMVSLAEYSLIEEMFKEGKISNSGHPKSEFLQEYCERLQKKRIG